MEFYDSSMWQICLEMSGDVEIQETQELDTSNHMVLRSTKLHNTSAQ